MAPTAPRPPRDRPTGEAARARRHHADPFTRSPGFFGMRRRHHPSGQWAGTARVDRGRVGLSPSGESVVALSTAHRSRRRGISSTHQTDANPACRCRRSTARHLGRRALGRPRRLPPGSRNPQGREGPASRRRGSRTGLQRDRLTTSQLQTDISLRLRQAGIRTAGQAATRLYVTASAASVTSGRTATGTSMPSRWSSSNRSRFCKPTNSSRTRRHGARETSALSTVPVSLRPCGDLYATAWTSSSTPSSP